MLFRNFLLQGEDGIVVKASFTHYLNCLRGFAVCQGLVSRMFGEISKALDKCFLLHIHVNINDTTKVNAEHTKDKHRVLSVRNSGIVFHMEMSLFLSDN